MASQQINCPHCNNALEIQSEWAGMTLTCPVCNQAFLCPKLSVPPPPAFQTQTAMQQDCIVPQSIPANELNIYLLKDIISENYGCKVNEDGVLQINGTYKLFISIVPNIEMICFHVFFNPEDYLSISEVRKLANRFNEEYRFLRVSIDDDGSTKCDYYMIYKGGLNIINFKETIEWMNSLIDGWGVFLEEAEK